MGSSCVSRVCRRPSAFVLAGLLALAALPAGAWVAPPRPPRAKTKPAATAAGNLDVRVTGRRDLVRVLSGNRVDARQTGIRAATQIQALGKAAAQLKTASPGAEVRFSPLFGAAEIVRNNRGALTGPAPGRAGKDIVLDFLRANAALYGLSEADLANLRFRGESLDRKSGLRMVRFEQVVNGLPVFQSDTRVTLDRNGRIIRVVGLLAPNAPVNAIAASPRTTAQQALVTAMQSVGIVLDPAKLSLRNAAPDGTRAEVVTGDPRIKGSAPSHLVYFPVGPGLLVPAWQQITFTKGPGDWNTLVDAGSGVLLWRKNMRSYASTQEARFSVYVQGDGKTPAESPAPHSPTDVTPGAGTQFPEIARTTVNMSTVEDATASPNGWIDDGGNTTTGNNTDTYLDTDADDAPDPGLLDNNGRPVGNLDGSGNPRDFLGTGYNYTPAPQGGNPDAGTAPTDTQFQRGSVTQLFYLTNFYHDRLYGLGFDEAAGNFQNDNFGKGGAAEDPVLAECQDGSDVDNANFSTPPDGTSGRMQMFLFDFPTPERDGSLDATVVLHELTHGLSNRLIGDGNGLIWDEGGGMGEGWSDFYALSLLFGSNAYDPTAKYVEGAYATYRLGGLTDNYLYGIRRFPYSTDNRVSPLTWADVDDVTFNLAGGITPSPLDFSGNGALEVHNVGEVWASTLWEVRSRVIADPAGADGDVPTGNDKMLSIVTDALKMTPINPSFVDARDALIDADCAANACANEKWIWAGFADRGLGYKAISPLGQDGISAGTGGNAFLGVGESFSMPYLDVNTLTVDDSLGNNNGAIDPGEPIRLTVELFNPWHDTNFSVPVATATLTTSTPGVTILTGSSIYPAIPAKNVASGTPFLFTVPKSALCGQSLHFTLTTTSLIGTTSVDFTVRVGNPSGTGAPVTYSRTIPGGLAVPDADRLGITDAMTIPDDLEIADLDFRVDDFPHTFTGDLTIGLKAPSGYGTSLIYLRGFFLGFPNNDGDNFTNTLIDSSSANDLNLTDDTSAPYTGDWLPAFNSPIWGLFGIPNLGPDPIDQLSYVEGRSSQGVWKVHVTDEFFGDIGQLNTWSLIVTPRAFTCAAFTPQAALQAAKTVAGTFVAGGAITYTITLKNTGSAPQADNPGNEFTDTLPATLTLVSASATSGTAAANLATNTVTWNGALPAVIGQTTITINATIKSTAAGQIIANQGQISFDADGNGTNESAAATDDPATKPASDPTSFPVAPGASVSGTKVVTGLFVAGGTATYTIVLTNSGNAAQGDNPGNEFTDVLPAGLTFAGATATSGVVANSAGTETWNGTIPAGGSETITVNATINPGALSTTISNQGTIAFDGNADGTNEATAQTDNPATPVAADPTTFAVSDTIVDVPTLSPLGFAALALLLAGAGFTLLRRKRTV
ncbi:MAG TPA: IPTL-CTERM sorting domain-containing protein [Thermoanaerobaculia bacterium]|nr:IPTL-CTERM sorting domain-containing protein [Thermoanaerobaculia bacterium]